MARSPLPISISIAMLSLVTSAVAMQPQPKNLAVAIVGQSNEQGTGSVPRPKPARALQGDPIPPNGGPHSMWPHLEHLAAERGVKIWVWNSAVGATSIVHGWAGTLRLWSPGITVGRGDYVLMNDHIWRRSGPTEAPILSASHIPPGTGMTTDNIVWEDLGPARAGETSGRVFRPGERLFDPNGYVRRALEGLSTKDGERWAFISIGQSDAGNYWMVTREQYAQALIAVTDAALAKGARVAIGFTSATAKPAVDAVYQERLIPGWRDALRHYKGDRRVVAGANLRLALGPLSVSQGEGPGLFPDKLHMNDAALDLAAQAWFNALVHAHVIPAH